MQRAITPGTRLEMYWIELCPPIHRQSKPSHTQEPPRLSQDSKEIVKPSSSQCQRHLGKSNSHTFFRNSLNGMKLCRLLWKNTPSRVLQKVRSCPPCGFA